MSKHVQLMTQNQKFSVKPPSRLEAIAHHADEKEGDCDHQRGSCSDSGTAATPADGVFGSDRLGGIMSSSSDCGAASNMRRCICTPTTALARPALRSAATCTSTTAGGHIRALTARHPIKPTSRRCPSAWQPNPGRRSTYRRGDSVQTTGTTSVAAHIRIAGKSDEDGKTRSRNYKP